ncbi:hypothetical protein J1N35_008300 [Gossypium stocksii]|uniref:Uncharacterized protein n=1 Tax=Gossypium stocksii TaxID=47602 RepID=A0A9D3W8L2_9ROSI|nr:hypothetical protein J1N35_008300 [Gossypium stocksii]
MQKALILEASTYTFHQSSADFDEHIRYKRIDDLLLTIGSDESTSNPLVEGDNESVAEEEGIDEEESADEEKDAVEEEYAGKEEDPY